MQNSILDEATVEEVARAALKIAKEAREHALEARRRLDELEHSQTRTLESMKGMFSAAVRENSRDQAAAIAQQTKAIEGTTKAVRALEGRRDREFANLRAVFIVLSVILTATVEFCRHT